MATTTTERATAVTVHDVNHAYGPRNALRDISFTLDAGSVVGLVGANGSGKSTLLRILAGVQKATSGSVIQFGTPIDRVEAAGEHVGAATDGMAMWPSWTVLRNLMYIAHLSGASRKDVDAALEMVDIASEARTRLRRLSLGNRQRVLLAAGIIAGTKLLLLDEPMNGLDPDTRQRIRALITQLSGQGRTVVLSSHDLHDVESLCSQLLVLDDGHLAFGGSTTEFVEGSQMKILRVDPASADRAQVALTEAGMHCRRDSSGAPVIFAHDITAAISALAEANVAVLATEDRNATLEERYHDRL